MEKTLEIAGDRSAALRYVEEVHTLSEGGTIVNRVGPAGIAVEKASIPAFAVTFLMMVTSLLTGADVHSTRWLLTAITVVIASFAGSFLFFRKVEEVRLPDRWSDTMTGFLVRRGAESVVPGLVGKAPDGTLSQTTTYTVKGRKMVAVLTGTRDGSPTTIKVGLASADQQEER